jgi:hypothetical protein
MQLDRCHLCAVITLAIHVGDRIKVVDGKLARR